MFIFLSYTELFSILFRYSLSIKFRTTYIKSSYNYNSLGSYHYKSHHPLLFLYHLKQPLLLNIFPALIHITSMRVILFVVTIKSLQQLLLIPDIILDYILESLPFDFLHKISERLLLLNDLEVLPLLYLNVLSERVDFLTDHIHHL